MFKCKLSLSCIHTKNVCDGTVDCPLYDDEIICIDLVVLMDVHIELWHKLSARKLD